MNIEYKGWKSYSSFFSAEYCQRYLKNSYQKHRIDHPEQKSYENGYAFLYYLEHGKIYYEQAGKAPLILKPILLFYGLVHLIKACILTVDPAYPETTVVLAHGVSTRKRKKQNYVFFQDEVKLQKNGLFPFISEKLFHMKHLEGEKVIMEELLQLIPELDELFALMTGAGTFKKLDQEEDYLIIPEEILDSYHMTDNRFKDYLTAKLGESIAFSEDLMGFSLQEDVLEAASPLKYNYEGGFYALPAKKGSYVDFPELLIHYLLLYNLSMIARYETEWWSELSKMMPNSDYPFIDTFLQITMEKGPFLIYQILMGK